MFENSFQYSLLTQSLHALFRLIHHLLECHGVSIHSPHCCSVQAHAILPCTCIKHAPHHALACIKHLLSSSCCMYALNSGLSDGPFREPLSDARPLLPDHKPDWSVLKRLSHPSTRGEAHQLLNAQ